MAITHMKKLVLILTSLVFSTSLFANPLTDFLQHIINYFVKPHP